MTLLTIGLGWTASLIASASLVPTPSPQQIAGGGEVAVCAWPTGVRLGAGCSATLIHPQVVLYAAHCGASATEISVGEVSAEGTIYAIDQCWQNPGWTGQPGGTDFAACRLTEPVPDIPIVPILMGCELQLLVPGVEVTSVGFGSAPDGPGGIKRAVDYPLAGVNLKANRVTAGGGDGDGTLCGGDSGGGTYIRGVDGSWRLMAVNTGVVGQPCVEGASVLALAAGAVAWVEEQTGFDVSPCYAADGTWDPNESCDAVPLDPAPGGGAWPSCEFGPLSGPLSTCGIPFAGEDLLAPTIEITDPADGQMFALADADTIPLAVTFEVDDDGGFGIASTALRINGRDIPGSADTWTPFEIPSLTLPEGTFILEAVATDWAGNEALSAPVTVTVGEPSLATGSEGSSTTVAGTDADGTTASVSDDEDVSTNAASGSGGTSGPPLDSEASGCSCRSSTSSTSSTTGGAGTAGFWACLALVLFRRRSRL